MNGIVIIIAAARTRKASHLSNEFRMRGKSGIEFQGFSCLNRRRKQFLITVSPKMVSYVLCAYRVYM